MSDTQTIETRVLRTHDDAEFRVSRKDGKITITGYASVFNSMSEDLGGFREIIRPGAFRKAISEGQDVRALINHDADKLLGRTTSGTLRLSEDKRGLKYVIDAPDTTYARDLAEVLERGDMSGSSFSFRVGDGESWRQEPEQMIREIREIDALYDVGPVTYPAYPASVSEVTRRSLERNKTDKPSTETPNERALQQIKAAKARMNL